MNRQPMRDPAIIERAGGNRILRQNLSLLY
jgi:hypothetical protein